MAVVLPGTRPVLDDVVVFVVRCSGFLSLGGVVNRLGRVVRQARAVSSSALVLRQEIRGRLPRT